MSHGKVTSRVPVGQRDNSLINLGQLDLNLLIALDALLQERHVTRAAERVSLTQPAMSRALGRLRRVFRDDLLVRIGNENQLTLYGTTLKRPVREILSLIARILASQPTFDASKDTRHFVIAAHDYCVLTILKPLFDLILKAASGVSLQITALSDSSVDGLETGQIDLIIRGAERLPHLPSQLLLKDQLIGAVWSSHPNVVDGCLSFDQYNRLPLLIYGMGPSSSVAQEFQLCPNRDRQIFQVPNFLLLPHLLTGTPLLALVPKRLGEYFTKCADIKLVDIPFALPPMTQSMFWHPRSNKDPSHRWLRERLSELSTVISDGSSL